MVLQLHEEGLLKLGRSKHNFVHGLSLCRGELLRMTMLVALSRSMKAWIPRFAQKHEKKKKNMFPAIIESTMKRRGWMPSIKSIFILCYLLLMYIPVFQGRILYVNKGSPKASDDGPGTKDVPFQSFKPATKQANPGDTILVSAGVYRERVAPSRGGTEGSPITYAAAKGETVYIRASENLEWNKQPSGILKATLSSELFDTLDGTKNSSLYNPFTETLQPGVGCVGFTTGQVYIHGKPLAEIEASAPIDHVKNCMVPYWIGHKLKHFHSPNGCFQPQENGTTLLLQLPDAINTTRLPDSEIEVTVRSRVFAPHKRGLQYINVEGFIMEYSANNWCANMWYPKNWRYAQSGILGTRSGYKWKIANNTLRYAKTIGLDIGIEGGYRPAGGGDNEGTNQPIPNVTGLHIITGNVIEYNGASGVQGYTSSGEITGNVVRYNGHNRCEGAENAAIKTHSFSGKFERNVIFNNSNGVPTWFDSGAHSVRISRNVFMTKSGENSAGVVFELTDGPVLCDNNIFLGDGSGPAIASQDASNITIVHNLAYGFKGNPSVVLGGLTGRKVNGHTAALRNWSVNANLLLSDLQSPFLTMHKEKRAADTGELIFNETVKHNLVTGRGAVYPENASLKIDVSQNINVSTCNVSISVDRSQMLMSVQSSCNFFSGCDPRGIGTDTSFMNMSRSPADCVGGPFAAIAPGSRVYVKLLSVLFCRSSDQQSTRKEDIVLRARKL